MRIHQDPLFFMINRNYILAQFFAIARNVFFVERAAGVTQLFEVETVVQRNCS